MYSYSTFESIKAKIPEEILLQLTDDEDAGSFVITPVPNAAYNRITAAINAVGTVIDSHVGGRYSLPFTTVPGELADISDDLVVCKLFDRKHEHKAPEGLAARYKKCMDWLKSIQAGDAVLVGVARIEPSAVVTNAESEGREFPQTLLDKM